jgi:hypothetical protein
VYGAGKPAKFGTRSTNRPLQALRAAGEVDFLVGEFIIAS